MTTGKALHRPSTGMGVRCLIPVWKAVFNLKWGPDQHWRDCFLISSVPPRCMYVCSDVTREPHPAAKPRPFSVTMAKALNTWTTGPAGLAKPLILAEITMSTSRKLKTHGMRRGKNRAPHKGVKRGGSKRKYRKSSLKSRKRGDDGKCRASGRAVRFQDVLSQPPSWRPTSVVSSNLSLRCQRSRGWILRAKDSDGCVLMGVLVVNLSFPTASRNYRSHL